MDPEQAATTAPEPAEAPQAPMGDAGHPAAGDIAEEGQAAAVPAADEGASTELVPADVDPTGVPVDAAPLWPFLGGGLALVLVAGALVARRSRAASPVPLLGEDAEQVQTQLPGKAPTPVPLGLAARLRDRMARSREVLQTRFDTLFGRDVVDEDLLEELEEVLLIADVGMPTTQRITDVLRARMKDGVEDPSALRDILREEVRALLSASHRPFAVPAGVDPFVLLVVGVNGSGKTTTIGKIASRLTKEGHKVLLAAGDTYRAAAAEQLQIWAERSGAAFVRHSEGADPAAVAYDALDAAKARGCDVVIIDTAGRLQTAAPLMAELTKIRRVIDKKVPGAPHDTLLVLDGTMGQNAMSQARSFHEATPLTGVVVTKLDGTAKGGMVLAVASEMGLPVTFIGIGEQADDLRPFEVDAFVEAMV